MNAVPYTSLEQAGIYSLDSKQICPQCSHSRNKSSDKCLSLKDNGETWKCHHCKWAGYIVDELPFNRPERQSIEHSVEALEFFYNRGISKDTLTQCKVTSDKSTIFFNYYFSKTLVNIKFRSIHEKKFWQIKNSQQTFYMIDMVEDKADTIYITEGEIDALSLVEIGLKNVISIPSGGVSSEVDNNSPKLHFLKYAGNKLLNAKKIVICFDNDQVGHTTAREIAKRIDEDKVRIINFPSDIKDANEFLQKHGGDAFFEFNNLDQRPVPHELVFNDDDIDKYTEKIINTPQIPEGKSVLMGEKFGNMYKMSLGQLTVVTGIPGSGKSEFIDNIMVRTAQEYKWTWGIFSPENLPVDIHMRKLISKVTFTKIASLQERAIRESCEWIKRNFVFFKADENFMIDKLVNAIRNGILRHDINCFVIDPFNYIQLNDMKYHSHTEAINEFLNTLNSISKHYNVHIILSAHPRKMEGVHTKNDVMRMETKIPTSYDIAGSAHFYNRADAIVIVHRHKNSPDKRTVVKTEKIRFIPYNGDIGYCFFDYDRETGVFTESHKQTEK